MIIADPQRVVFVCRCGQRSVYRGLSLADVVGLVQDEPMRPAWSRAQDAIRALGFAPHPRGPFLRVMLPRRRPRLRVIVAGMVGARRD